MFAHGKEIRITKSAFEDMVKLGLHEHRIVSIIEEGKVTRIGKTEKYHAEVGVGEENRARGLCGLPGRDRGDKRQREGAKGWSVLSAKREPSSRRGKTS